MKAALLNSFVKHREKITNMDKKHTTPKRIAAIIGLIIIAAAILVLLIGMLTQNTSLIMAAIFSLVVIPALIYLFLLVTKLGGKQ